MAAKTQPDGPPRKKVVQLHTVKVWRWGENKTPHYDDDNYHVAKSIVLVKASHNSHTFLLNCLRSC